jgi:hypothetical protein
LPRRAPTDAVQRSLKQARLVAAGRASRCGSPFTSQPCRALLGHRYRIPEVAVPQRRVLHIRQRRRDRHVLDLPGGSVSGGGVARPRRVTRSVRIAGPGEIGPGCDERVGKLRLPRIQRMGRAQRAPVPEREDVLDVGGVIGQWLEARQWREVERRRLVGELIGIDRDLRRQGLVEPPLVANAGVGPDPVPRQLRALEGAERIDRQNLRCRPVRILRATNVVLT